MASPVAGEIKPTRQRVPLRVLFYEDCMEDLELSVDMLRSAGFDVSWDIAATPSQLMELARIRSYDAILSDFRMPQMTGVNMFERLKAEGIVTPFILVSGSLGEEMAVECLKLGISDYVLKDRLEKLPTAVRRARQEEKARRDQAIAEESLRASEASYRSLIQSAPCGILRLSAANGRLLEANAALAEMLGYDSPAGLVAATSESDVGLDADTLKRVVTESSAASGEVHCDVRWKRRGAGEVLLQLKGRLLQDSNGAPGCIEMIAENISERHLAQQRIRQLNRLLSLRVQVGHAIVRTRESATLFEEICRIIVKEGGFQLAWLGLLEPATRRVTPRASYPPGDPYLEGIHISAGAGSEGRGPIGFSICENRSVVINDLFGSPEMIPWRNRAMRGNFRSVASFPIVVRRRPIGALAIYSGVLNFFDNENVALLSELAADLSFALESIENEQSHRRVAGELDQFFALSLDMLCIFDLDGRLQRVNPAWEKTLRVSVTELCSRPWIEFVHPDDREAAAAAMERLRSGEEVHDLELRFRSGNGSHLWFAGSAAPDRDRGVVFAALRDITVRKELEEQLRTQNMALEERNRRVESANRMKSEFLANMSHELRSPLNGIIGFSELLYDGKLGEIEARPRQFVDRVHASATHLLQLINGLLDLSKIEAGHLEFHPEPAAVSAIIREVAGILSPAAGKKRISIDTQIENEADEVMIDTGRLRQVLHNYLSNAVKFTPDGGRVAVRLKAEGENSFRLEVSDTGIGIAEEDIPRLFSAFQQLDATSAKRFEGTGLGLALTKRIVESQGGRVGVTSRPGDGSTFFAVLPRVPLRALAPDAEKAPTQTALTTDEPCPIAW